MVANVCQTVDYLPHERYDATMSAIELFGEMISTLNIHHHTELQDICRWPRYHNNLMELKESDVY